MIYPVSLLSWRGWAPGKRGLVSLCGRLAKLNPQRWTPTFALLKNRERKEYGVKDPWEEPESEAFSFPLACVQRTSMHSTVSPFVIMITHVHSQHMEASRRRGAYAPAVRLTCTYCCRGCATARNFDGTHNRGHARSPSQDAFFCQHIKLCNFLWIKYLELCRSEFMNLLRMRMNKKGDHQKQCSIRVSRRAFNNAQGKWTPRQIPLLPSVSRPRSIIRQLRESRDFRSCLMTDLGREPTVTTKFVSVSILPCAFWEWSFFFFLFIEMKLQSHAVLFKKMLSTRWDCVGRSLIIAT